MIEEDLQIVTGEFHRNEVKCIIKGLKRNKSAGPDKTTAEMFKIFDEENITILTNLINEIWERDELPESVSNA